MSGEADAKILPVEIVHIHVYDIGRMVDLKKAKSYIPAHPDLGIAKRRDTPASLKLPKPLVLQLNAEGCDAACLDRFGAYAKIYDDGALTIVVRYRTQASFSDLAALADMKVGDAENAMTVTQFAANSFSIASEAVRPAVTGYREAGDAERETYTAFCLLECPGGDPAAFLERNREAAAALISGEKPGTLHESQVGQITARPFCYRKDDLALFDMDRCLIIDPERDYEDLLIIAEIANYRLNELRVLDSLLDRWLEDAERDIRKLYLSSGRVRLGAGSLRTKLARIAGLRFDALFTLENLDNSSKIIGDYFLGLVYERLCSMFNTEGWKISVERRLAALQNLYEMLKTDSGEQRMLVLEIVFIVVCIVFPTLQIVQVFLSL